MVPKTGLVEKHSSTVVVPYGSECTILMTSPTPPEEPRHVTKNDPRTEGANVTRGPNGRGATPAFRANFDGRDTLSPGKVVRGNDVDCTVWSRKNDPIYRNVNPCGADTNYNPDVDREDPCVKEWKTGTHGFVFICHGGFLFASEFEIKVTANSRKKAKTCYVAVPYS